MRPMRTFEQLESGWAELPPPPRGAGTVRMLCLRKGGGVHETPHAVEITLRHGVRGDRWAERQSGFDPDGYSAITLMNATAAELVAAGAAPLHESGDNVFVDLDLSVEALPAGTRLAIGDAVLQVSVEPHTGCSKFRDRFGLDALKWVSTPSGRARRLRGVNCSVVRAGAVRVGDSIRAMVESQAPTG